MVDQTRVVSGDADGGQTGGERPRWVVGVGSSAGGIEALTGLLSALPADPTIAYLVAQHLSPTHTSPLVDVLQRATGLAVTTAVDGAMLQGGTIYVAPPNSDIGVTATNVTLAVPSLPHGAKPSIDLLFRSAAQSWGERAVGIVLSGTGSDGADGFRSIRAAGGLTIAQRPDTAKFETMPRAAASEGEADFVLSPGEMGATLARLCSAEEMPFGRTTKAASEPALLEAIILAVRAATGIDLGGYKETTLRRQVARRQAIAQIDDLARYRDLIASDVDEARALAQRLLVSVTSFFRDPESWKALRSHVDALVAGLDPFGHLRVWVPGCATGEEAYTVAMVVAEALGQPADLNRRMKIFATDLDEAALEIARRGQYASGAIADIPECRRDKWMQPCASGWEVAPSLRDCTVFARHDIAFDPPFPRLNMISLRNTLIYFKPELQRRVLRSCHFALVPGGILLVGDSERTTALSELFATVDAKHRIYRRRDIVGVGPYPIVPPARSAAAMAALSSVGAATGRPADDSRLLRDALVRLYAPPALVIDDNGEVVEVIGDVARWCWIADGPHSRHVTALVRAELQPTVRMLVVQLHHGPGEPKARRVRMDDGIVDVAARWLGEPVGGLAVLTFEPVTAMGAQDAGVPAPAVLDAGLAGVETGQAERELRTTQEALRATIEELAASNEELTTLNEELTASSEELTASSEELSAANEELEATNEELATLNEELQIGTSDLVAANADLENIQASMNSGIVLVDRDLRVRRFNPPAVHLFSLIEADVGRPLTAIAATAPIPDLHRRLRAVVDDSGTDLIEVVGDRTESLLQILPYRAADGAVWGAMLVVTDVSPLAQMRRLVRQSLSDLENVTEALREMVWLREADGTLRVLNRQVETIFGLDRAAVKADPSLLLTAVHPDDRDRVNAAAASVSKRRQIEYRICRPGGEVRWIEESAIAVPGDGDDSGFIVGSALDVTERNEAIQRAADHQRIFRSVFDNDVFGVVVLNAEGHIRMANRTFALVTGYDAASLVGMALAAIAAPDNTGPGSSPTALPDALGPGIHERRIVTRDNASHWVTLDVRPLETSPGQDADTIVIVHDVTQARLAAAEITTRAHFDSLTGLANRGWFRERLAQELSRAERRGPSLALLWIDLDGFKEVNDRYGHKAGDIVLSKIASRLQALVRKQDIVARLGGDEFAVLVTDVAHVDGLEILIERVLDVLRRPIDIGDDPVFLSGSIGVAMAPADGRHPDELLASADSAMYGAKEAGRDRHAYFELQMNETALRRAEQRGLLAAALRSRAFVMYYQPIVDPVTNAIAAAEALVRWRRGGEIVVAADFIDLAEQTGQVRALGRIILDLVRDDIDALSTEHGLEELPIALNLSPTQLEERSFLDLLLAWDVRGGFGRLIAEVTESALLDLGGNAFEALTLLQRVGARISIDDFGTGYANLALLERLQPSIIKLDQTLLRRADQDRRGRALLRGAVELAHALDAVVVLEGVETEDQCGFARDLGVEWVQGYHLARPMPLEEMVAWAESHQPS